MDLRHRQRTRDELVAHRQWREAFDRASLIVDDGGIVVLLGDRGNGKTQMGVELVRDSCRQCQHSLYFRAREIPMRLRECYRTHESELDAMNKLASPALLVIDEIQELGESDFDRRVMTLLLDRRYGACVPTVLIGNTQPSNLIGLLGGSAVDRIKELGGVIRFSWPSFRKGNP